MNLENIMKEKRGTIVDVRTRVEFLEGTVSCAVNIPLQEIANRIEELKSLKTPLVLCCASGNRSAMAQRYLTERGIECVNGGSWLSVHNYNSNSLKK